MEVQYLSNRTNRPMEREGQVIVDQHPGDERRLVLLRPNGKKLMICLQQGKLAQRRDDESKWTKTGRLLGVRGLIEDECPDCGSTTCTLLYRNVKLVAYSKRPGRTTPINDSDKRLQRSKLGEWYCECNCGARFEPRLEPEQPPWPEPETTDSGELLVEAQKYAEHVNEEIFDSEIDLDAISWEWNSRNTNTAGRAWAYKIQLTPAYLEKHGWNEFLKVIRHELIHVWESHAGNDRSGHSAQFHDWLVRANTRRHCKHF